MAVDALFDRIINQVMQKHFPAEHSEWGHLRIRAAVKRSLLGQLVDDRFKASAAFSDLKEWGEFLEKSTVAGVPRAGASKEELRQAGSLDENLRAIFARLHTHDPQRFEEFLAERLDRAAATQAAFRNGQSAPWVERVILDDAGRVHAGKAAGWIGGIAAAGAGAVALLRHRRDAEDQREPSNGNGRG